MSMNLQEVASFQNALNNPIKAMVQGIESGAVLEEGHIKIAEGHIKTITEDWIPSEEEAFQHHAFYNGNFANTEAGKAIKERIKKYKRWMKVIEKAIEAGKVEAKKKLKEKEAVTIEKLKVRAKESQAKIAKHNGKLIRATVALGKLLDGRDIRDVFYAVIRERGEYRSAVNQLAKRGVTCGKLPPLKETDLEDAVNDLTGNVSPSRRRSADKRAQARKTT